MVFGSTVANHRQFSCKATTSLPKRMRRRQLHRLPYRADGHRAHALCLCQVDYDFSNRRTNENRTDRPAGFRELSRTFHRASRCRREATALIC